MFVTLKVYLESDQVAEISNNPDGGPDTIMVEFKDLNDGKPANRIYLSPKEAIEDLPKAFKAVAELVKSHE